MKPDFQPGHPDSLRPIIIVNVPSRLSCCPGVFPAHISGVSNTAAQFVCHCAPQSAQRPDNRDNRLAIAIALAINGQQVAIRPSVIWHPFELNENPEATATPLTRTDPDGMSRSAPVATLPNPTPLRHADEPRLAYVRRLKEFIPDLTAKDAAAISGALRSNIRQMPEFRTATATAAAAIAAIPARRANETAVSYISRLKENTPNLSVRDAAMATELNTQRIRKMQIFSPSAVRKLVANAGAHARGNRSSVSSGASLADCNTAAPADRKKLANAHVPRFNSQQASSNAKTWSEGRAIVKDLGFLRNQDSGSDTIACSEQTSPALSYDGAAAALTVRPVVDQTMPDDSPLLVVSSKDSVPGLMTGIPVRRKSESGLAYVRRLKRHFPKLTADSASAMSSVALANIRRLPEFTTLSPLAQFTIDAIPPRAKDETTIVYAARLKKQEPRLTVIETALASGVSTWRIRNMPGFVKLTDAARAAMDAISPREFGESHLSYAKRLKKQTPSLSVADAAAASGAYASNLRPLHEFEGERNLRPDILASAATVPTPEPAMPPVQKPTRQSFTDLQMNHYRSNGIPATSHSSVTPVSPVSSISSIPDESNDRQGLMLSSQDIADIGTLLLRRKGVFNNQLGDLAPWLLVGSPQFPANVVINIEERRSDGTVHVYTVSRYDAQSVPQQAAHQITLRLERKHGVSTKEGDATAHYSFKRPGGDYVPIPADGDCFYNAVAGALRQCGLPWFSVLQLRNMAADVFEAHPSEWLAQTEHDVLMGELRQARAAMMNRLGISMLASRYEAQDHDPVVSRIDRESAPSMAMNALLLNRTQRNNSAEQATTLSWQPAFPPVPHPRPSMNPASKPEQVFRENLRTFLTALPNKIRTAREMKHTVLFNSGLHRKGLPDYFCTELEDRISALLGTISTHSVRDLQSDVAEQISPLLLSEITESIQDTKAVNRPGSAFKTTSQQEYTYWANNYIQCMQGLIDDMDRVLWDRSH